MRVFDYQQKQKQKQKKKKKKNMRSTPWLVIKFNQFVGDGRWCKYPQICKKKSDELRGCVIRAWVGHLTRNHY